MRVKLTLVFQVPPGSKKKQNDSRQMQYTIFWKSGIHKRTKRSHLMAKLFFWVVILDRFYWWFRSDQVILSLRVVILGEVSSYHSVIFTPNMRAWHEIEFNVLLRQFSYGDLKTQAHFGHDMNELLQTIIDNMNNIVVDMYENIFETIVTNEMVKLCDFGIKKWRLFFFK